MPLHSDSSHAPRSLSEGVLDDERSEFCRRLKQTRERKGIALAAIAERTKIRASLFAALEHNDLRSWPQGLYRRAYFREYARVVDTHVDELCEEFNRLFTAEADAAPPARPGEPQPVRSRVDPAADMRLELDAKFHGSRPSVLSRFASAMFDLLVVSIISAVMTLLSGFDASVTVAAVALAYFSLATVLFGESPAKWMYARREAIVAAFKSDEAPSNEDQQPSAVEDRPWMSDATRVGPSPPPQLRVRFKV